MTRVVAAGVDSLTLTWQATGVPRALEERFDELRATAEAARQEGRPAPVLTTDVQSWRVKAAARFPFRWLFESTDGDYTVAVAPGTRPQGTPAVKCDAHAVALWASGVERWVSGARTACDALLTDGETGECAMMHEEHVSRLDLAVDVQGWELTGTDDELAGFACRARPRKSLDGTGVEVYGRARGFTGYTFGRSPELRLRVYNKTRELAVSGKGWMVEQWKRSPDYVDGQDVWRVEPQLRRAPLKQLAVEGFDRRQLDRLWRWATKTWITHRRETGDSNRSRWPVSDAWKVVQSATFVEDAEPAVRIRARRLEAERLAAQALGCAASYGALYEVDPTDERALERTLALMVSETNRESFAEKLVERRRENPKLEQEEPCLLSNAT